MQRIPFRRPAAWVTLAEALGLAWRYWAASWERWLLAVVAVALADGLATWLIGRTMLDQRSMALLTSGGDLDPSLVPRLMAAPLALAVVSLVADWFLYANAVVGLRGRPMTPRWVVGAGLRVLLALVALSAGLVVLLLPFSALGPVAVVGALVALPIVAYLVLRLQFWVLGVFDGLGLAESVRRSWEISRGAVLRVLGWVLALFGVSLLVSIAAGSVTGLLGTLPGPVAAAGSGIATLIETAAQAYAVIVTAILYESQLQRSHGAAGPAPGWSEAAPRDVDGTPLGPPPPPPVDPWRG